MLCKGRQAKSKRAKEEDDLIRYGSLLSSRFKHIGAEVTEGCPLNETCFIHKPDFITGMLMFSPQGAAYVVKTANVYLWLPLCMLLLVTCSVSLAPMPQKTAGKASSITLTGCLQEGRILDRFVVSGRHGKIYSLRSKTIKLSERVGHNVSIKGQLTPDEKRDEYDFEGSEVNEAYGKGKLTDPIDVDVISLKVLGAPCR